MPRLIIKTENPDGVPNNWEITDFEHRKGVSVNEVNRLYVAYKVGKRRKIKRLRINRAVHPCELCGQHIYVSGSVGTALAFDREIF